MNSVDQNIIIGGLVTLLFVIMNLKNYRNWKDQPFFMKHLLIYLAISFLLFFPFSVYVVIDILLK